MRVGDHEADPRPAGARPRRRPRRGGPEDSGEPGPQRAVVLAVVGQVERWAAAGRGDVVAIPGQVGAPEDLQGRLEPAR